MPTPPATHAQPSTVASVPPAPPVAPVAPVAPAVWSWLIPLIIVLAGTLAYANSFWGKFVFDDNDYILNDASVRHVFPLSDHFHYTDRRPLPKLSFALSYALSRYDPRGWHALNLLIHLAASLVFFGIVRRTLLLPRFGARFATSARWIALACALFWMLHPLQTQSVTYVVQREESLMGMFFMLTLYCAIRGATATRRAWGWFGAAVVACFLGMVTKEVMVVAPLVVILYDWVFLTRSYPGTTRRRLPFYAALCLPYLAILLIGVKDIFLNTAAKNQGFFSADATAYALTQAKVIIYYYLRLCFWPSPLCLDYYDVRPPKELWTTAPYVATIGIMLLLTAWGIVKRHWMGFVGGAFFLILAPTSSIMPIRDLVMEHRMYLPLACVVVPVVIGGWWALDYAQRVEPHRAPFCRLMSGALVTIMAVLLGERTVLRNADYYSSEDIYRSITVARPDNSRGWRNLAAALSQQGKLAAACAVLADHELRIAPEDIGAWTSMALMHLDLKNPTAALGDLSDGLALAPHDVAHHKQVALAHYDIAMILINKNPPEAEKQLRMALQIDPDFIQAYEMLSQQVMFTNPAEAESLHLKALAANPYRDINPPVDPPPRSEIHNNLASLYMRLHRFPEAAEQYRLALADAPAAMRYGVNMGLALFKAGHIAEARQVLDYTLKHAAPGDPAIAAAYANLADMAVAQRDYREGVGDLRRAMQLSAGRSEFFEYARHLAWLLVTAPAPYADKLEALSLAEETNTQTGGTVPEFLSTLAAAYAANDRFPEALGAVQKALPEARRLNETELLPRLDAQIKAYAAGRAWAQTPATQP